MKSLLLHGFQVKNSFKMSISGWLTVDNPKGKSRFCVVIYLQGMCVPCNSNADEIKQSRIYHKG